MRARIDEGASAARLSLLASAVVVALWTVLQPRTADLAAQVYRTGLFERVGWVLWDHNWFGGHHLPGYSLFTPWLLARVGIGVTGAGAAATTTLAFAAIVRAKGRGRWLWPTAWVAWAAAGDLCGAVARAEGTLGSRRGEARTSRYLRPAARLGVG